MTMAEFRRKVDTIIDPTHKYIVRFMYLTAGRASEGAGIYSPSQAESQGPLKENIAFDEYDKKEVLKISLSTLKKRKHPKRIIALPIDKKYEPWSYNLIEYFDKLDAKDPVIPYSRHTIARICKANGFAETGRLNPLRHIRLTHLADFYTFDSFDLVIYAGWKFQSVGVGGPIDNYIHLSWQKYFPKLKKALN